MSVGVALVWSTRIYIFININRRGGAKSKLRDLFLSSKFHNERVLYFWIFSAIFAYHLHPLYFCALEFSINAWTSEWWIIEPVLIKDKPHRIHRMRFAFALFINKWTDLAKFSSFFLWNLVRFNNSIRYSTTQDDHVRSDKSLNYHFFAKPSSLRPSKFPNRRPCNEATPSALFSSSSFQTIVTQRSVNKRELISCCPTRFVSLWQSWQVLQPKTNQTRFVRAVLVRENGSLLASDNRIVSWNPLPFHSRKYRYRTQTIHAKESRSSLLTKIHPRNVFTSSLSRLFSI